MHSERYWLREGNTKAAPPQAGEPVTSLRPRCVRHLTKVRPATPSPKPDVCNPLEPAPALFSPQEAGATTGR